MLTSDVRINGSLIDQVEIVRLEELDDLDREYRYEVISIRVFETGRDDYGIVDRFEIVHRYSDGASILLSKVWGEIARRRNEEEESGQAKGSSEPASQPK